MLASPFYIEPRKNERHLALDGEWYFTFEEIETESPDFTKYEMPVTLPRSTYWNLCEAGVLPDPYRDNNAEKYLWVRQKVWYYKKHFSVLETFRGSYAVLCFDGAAYYSRIWLNGRLLGSHEGMFGGPFINVSDALYYGGDNEIIVEIKAPSYKDPNFTPRNSKRTNTQIVPWCAAGDEESGSQNYIVMGIWRSVRIEFLNKKHLSRPVLTTERLENGNAVLRLEAEISDGEIDELLVDTGLDSGCYGYTRAYDGGNTGEKLPDPLKIRFEMKERQGGETALLFEEDIYLNDRAKSGINPAYYASQYFEKKFTLENAKLWYPHTLGEPFLYEVTLTLFEGTQQLDALCFDFGVRTVRIMPAAVQKQRHRWGKFQLEVNGRKFFLKGMNSMPNDFLYREEKEKTDWTLETAKNAGIELMRVWNGGGGPESDEFYACCDRLGLLVWQDWFIANTEVPQYPQNILEEQMMLNLYRLRNHPSLAVHCGGNEFNPYAPGNAAAMYVMQRSIEDLDSLRPFIRTTADGGSAHIYRDIEPVWFSKRYKELPFVGESGIHSFPNIWSLKALLPHGEYERLEASLPNLFDRVQMEKFPAFLAHFVEYVPERIPRMIARASTVTDVFNGISLSDFAEASQIASYEFYQLMLFAMRDNYPKTAGVMPWVFKRPWTAVGIQLVDGSGFTIAPYYSVKNAYAPLSVMLRLPEMCFAAGEEIPFTGVIFKDGGKGLSGKLRVTVYSPRLLKSFESITDFDFTAEKTELFCGSFTLPEEFEDKAFIVSAALETEDKTVKTFYFPKCLKELSDDKARAARREAPSPNPIYKNGPWLKETVQSAGTTEIAAEVVETHSENGKSIVKIALENKGVLPAFPVKLAPAPGASEEIPLFYLSDNYFLLEPNETKELVLTSAGGKLYDGFEISGWNFKAVTLSL